MLSSLCRRSGRGSWRLRSARYASTTPDPDLRTRLMGEIKTAMKNKDAFTSTTLRSLLSDVYNADKGPQGKVDSSAIAMILRKAVERRNEAMTKFQAASREDLADKELQEVNVIAKLLPPTLTETEVDAILSSIIQNMPTPDSPQKALGLVFKEFYGQVDKSRVDANLVKRRTQLLLSASS